MHSTAHCASARARAHVLTKKYHTERTSLRRDHVRILFIKSNVLLKKKKKKPFCLLKRVYDSQNRLAFSDTRARTRQTHSDFSFTISLPLTYIFSFVWFPFYTHVYTYRTTRNYLTCIGKWEQRVHVKSLRFARQI